MLKKIIRNILYGISWGCVVSCVVGMIGTMCMGNAWFTESGHSYAAQVLAAMIVGIGWVLPSIVYENDRLALGIQMLIHFVIGFGVYFPTAFFMGWIPGNMSLGGILLEMLFMAVISLVIWFCYYLYYYREAKRVNAKLKKKKEMGEL